MGDDFYEFAMVMSVTPGREAVWERTLRTTPPPPGVQMTVRSPHLAMFTVNAAQEFLAIDEVDRFLQQTARLAGVQISTNAQPSHEV